MNEQNKAMLMLGLHLLLGFVSFGAVFSKLAAESLFLSPTFIAFYGLVLVVLVVYAIGWQQVIKRLPLTTAYANRAITVVWGILWGIVFFDDTLTWGKVLGAVLVVVGVILWSLSDCNEKEAEVGRRE